MKRQPTFLGLGFTRGCTSELYIVKVLNTPTEFINPNPPPYPLPQTKIRYLGTNTFRTDFFQNEETSGVPTIAYLFSSTLRPSFQIS